MENTMPKSRKNSTNSENLTEMNTPTGQYSTLQKKKSTDVKRKNAEEAMRIRHVEGLREQMIMTEAKASRKNVTTPSKNVTRAQEDASGMVDAGFDAKGLPVMGRTLKSNLLAQMQKAGVDVTKPTPGISRLNPETQLRINPKDNRPFMTFAHDKTTFRGMMRKILSNIGGVLKGSHMNVAPTKSRVSPKKSGGRISPPRQRKPT